MIGGLIFFLILAAFMSPLMAGSNAYRDARRRERQQRRRRPRRYGWDAKR